jgi:hypothetical protein
VDQDFQRATREKKSHREDTKGHVPGGDYFTEDFLAGSNRHQIRSDIHEETEKSVRCQIQREEQVYTSRPSKRKNFATSIHVRILDKNSKSAVDCIGE